MKLSVSNSWSYFDFELDSIKKKISHLTKKECETLSNSSNIFAKNIVQIVLHSIHRQNKTRLVQARSFTRTVITDSPPSIQSLTHSHTLLCVCFHILMGFICLR